LLPTRWRQLLSSRTKGDVLAGWRGDEARPRPFLSFADLFQWLNLRLLLDIVAVGVCRLLLLTLSTGEFGWGGTSVK